MSSSIAHKDITLYRVILLSTIALAYNVFSFQFSTAQL